MKDDGIAFDELYSKFRKDNPFYVPEGNRNWDEKRIGLKVTK